MRAKILNEVVGASIEDIILPDDFAHNREHLAESSWDKASPIQVVLSNGGTLLVYGIILLSEKSPQYPVIKGFYALSRGV